MFALAIFTSKDSMSGFTLSNPAYAAKLRSVYFKENSPPNFGIIISAYYSVGLIIDSNKGFKRFK
jgi:hypothetical protein